MKKDEFVPFVKLNEIITQRNWPLQVHVVRKDNYIGEKVSYHLIIDKDSVGPQMWSQIKKAMKKHFILAPEALICNQNDLLFD